MFILRREDRTNPFAALTHLTEGMFKKAVVDELCAKDVTIAGELPEMEIGETFTIKCQVIDEDGDIYDWEIEVTDVVRY